ncbi:MAG: J domain-containing protein [Coriobacteriia bacterium]|nr:J domain-containing protein [Coriobacteriia bacterium]
MEEVRTSIATQIAEARERIEGLLLEIDDIVLQVNPHIEAEYATKIGYLENDLLKWQIAARRARRRFTLAQARANAGQGFAEDEFEEQLDAELADWEAYLAKSMQAFLQAAEHLVGRKPLSPSETRELKRVHRELIKRLHPDLHPGQSDDEERFFKIAQAAYERGDLSMLCTIAVATEGMGGEPDDSVLSEDEAAAELEIVLAHERVIEQRLSALKQSNPYALMEKLEDGVWVVQRTTELKAQIEEQKAVARAYDERFRALMERDGDGY